MSRANDVLSVSEYTGLVKNVLEDNIPESWVRGEISNLRRQSSGHVYFSLKDKRSQLSCVLFRGDALRQTIEINNGMQVLVRGRINIYEPRGSYQLIAREVVEDGVGELQRAFEALKLKLAEEGLFDPERKKRIPECPLTIGIITSPTGAALRDFISILKRRGWRGRLIVFPAKVQGADAVDDLLSMLHEAEELNMLDLLVISRGGGSLEDLWSFNIERLVRAVAACEIPVISGIGHEIDFTLCDFASDKRAETPSAAAELISSSFIEVVDRVGQASKSLTNDVSRELESKSAKLMLQANKLLILSPKNIIEQYELRLDDLMNRMNAAAGAQMHDRMSSMSELRGRLMAVSPLSRLEFSNVKFKNVAGRYMRLGKTMLDERKHKINSIEKRLDVSSMDKTLLRGFSIVRDEKGRVVNRAKGLRKGQKLSNQFLDGQVNVEVASEPDLLSL